MIKEKEKYFNTFKNYKRMCSNLVSEISEFSWEDAFCKKQVKELYGKLIKEFDNVDFTQFTSEELKEFDFRWFDENLLCMPMWALKCLPDGAEVYPISMGDDAVYSDDEKIIFKKSKGLDNDTRMGITAYGFTRSQLRDVTIDRIIN